MTTRVSGTPRSLYLHPAISKPCIELLMNHYRSRIALIDQLVDDIGRLRGDRIPACTNLPTRLSGTRHENGRQASSGFDVRLMG